jgi:putative metallopeptidase DUF4344
MLHLRRSRLCAAACALALAACDAPREPEAAPAAPPPAPAPAPAPTAAPGLDGRFVTAYGRVRDPTYAQWQEDFRQAGFLEGIAEWMNDWVALPEDVALTFGECGEPNAFYHPEERAVVLCFELVEELDGVFARDQDAERSVEDALVFLALHEVGHALVDVLDLPVTGREEDAADQLAALVLVDGSEEGVVAAINGVRSLPADEDALDDLTLADEHALNAQRYYSVLCLVYGHDPDTYAGWVEDGTLPPERAARCPQEYEQAARAWDRLLAPYLKG